MTDAVDATIDEAGGSQRLAATEPHNKISDRFARSSQGSAASKISQMIDHISNAGQRGVGDAERWSSKVRMVSVASDNDLAIVVLLTFRFARESPARPQNFQASENSWPHCRRSGAVLKIGFRATRPWRRHG